MGTRAGLNIQNCYVITTNKHSTGAYKKPKAIKRPYLIWSKIHTYVPQK